VSAEAVKPIPKEYIDSLIDVRRQEALTSMPERICWCQACKVNRQIVGTITSFSLELLGIKLLPPIEHGKPETGGKPCDIRDVRLCRSCIAKLVAMIQAGLIQPHQVALEITRDYSKTSENHGFPMVTAHRLLITDASGAVHTFKEFCQTPGLPNWCRKKWSLSTIIATGKEEYVASSIYE
jgi:hypothetical protein